jgi:deoxyribonuclease V
MFNQDDDKGIIELIKQVKDLSEAEKIQIKYSHLFKTKELEKLTIKSWSFIEYITAVDISYYLKDDVEYGIACAVQWDFKNNKMKQAEFFKDQITFPYVPGYLGFREVPLIVKCLKKLTIKPHMIICDGHGIIHPRRFGEATHLGFALNIPTFGVAKNPFVGVSDLKTLKRSKGEKILVMDGSEALGYAICLEDSKKPVFISPGFKIHIDLAIKVALYLTNNNRQPEPLFLADRLSRIERSKIKT